MNRVYITAIPLESNYVIQPQPVRAANFHLKEPAGSFCYPIIPIMRDTAEPGDRVTLLVVRQDNGQHNRNRDILLDELKSIRQGNCELRDIAIPESQNESVFLELFRRMIGAAEDNSCYYACMTFGTKTYPVVLFSVLSYIEKAKKNTQVKGIYYQEILRENGVVKEAKIYNMTSLFLLNSIMEDISELQGDSVETVVQILLDWGAK